MTRLILLAILTGSCAGLSGAVLERLPRSPFADTESTTNCPFVFDTFAIKNFRFDMTLAGTPSNCVQLAFGRDADADGALAPEETDMTFAWDCGCWRIAGLGEGGLVSRSCAPVTTNDVKILQWDLELLRRLPHRLSVAENGEPVFAELSDASWDGAYDPDWNMFRLTVRGVDAPEEDVRVYLNVKGMLFIAR